MAEFFGLLFSLITVLFVVLPILTFIRMGRISRELEELKDRVAELERQRASAAAWPQPTTFGSANAFAAGPSEVVAPPPLAAAADQPPSWAPATPSAWSAPPTLSAPGAPVAPMAPAAPAPPSTPASPARPAAPAAPAPPTPPSPPIQRAPAAPDPPSPPSPPGQRAAPDDEPDLEERIGGRGLLYTGVLVLLFGVSFFLKYAFDNAWINETGRVTLGALTGIALVVTGLRLAARDLAVFGHALAGTGLAILYLDIYAALNFYAMLSPAAAFLLMTLITLGAGVIADWQRAQSLAVIAVGGGFLTPFLVGSDDNAQLALFSYIALLAGGTMLLSLRHRWLALNAISYVGTFVLVVAWAGRHYSDDQWLRTLLFLTLFCVLFLVILRETNGSAGATPRLVTGLLSTAPVFYHIAAIVITAQHAPAIHVYLIAFTAAGIWVTAEPHRPVLRLAVLLAAFVPMFGTLTFPDGLSWTMPNVVTIVAVAALHTLAILDRALRQEARLDTAELVTLHLTGLGLFALLYTALQPAYPGVRGALAALIAIGALGLWRWLHLRDPLASLNAAALAFTLAAIGIAVQFDGPTVVVGWAAEGAAVAWLGIRARRHAFQFGGLLLWALAAVRLVDGFSETPSNFTVLLNARTIATLFVVMLGYALAWMFSRSDAPEAGRARAGLHVLISVLTLMWLTAEIRSYWEVRYLSSQAHVFQQMMLSLAWGAYGALLIVVGMMRRYAPLRYIGMTILAITVLKVFFYDLWELGGIYRVVGFMGFGVLLVLVSYLYQKRRRVTPPASDRPTPNDAATP